MVPLSPGSIPSGPVPIQGGSDISKPGEQQIRENVTGQVFIHRFNDLCNGFSLREFFLGVPRESRIQTTLGFSADEPEIPVVTFEYKGGTLSIPLKRSDEQPGWPSRQEISDAITKEIIALAKSMPGFTPHRSIANRLMNAVTEHGELQRTFLQPIVRPQHAEIPAFIDQSVLQPPKPVVTETLPLQSPEVNPEFQPNITIKTEAQEGQEKVIVRFEFKLNEKEGTRVAAINLRFPSDSVSNPEQILRGITDGINQIAKQHPGFMPHPDRLFNALMQHDELKQNQQYHDMLWYPIRPDHSGVLEPIRPGYQGMGILSPLDISRRGRRIVQADAQNLMSFDGMKVEHSPLKDGHVQVTLSWEGRQFQLDVAGSNKLDIEKAVKHQLVRPAGRQVMPDDDFPSDVIISNLTEVIWANGKFEVIAQDFKHRMLKSGELTSQAADIAWDSASSDLIRGLPQAAGQGPTQQLIASMAQRALPRVAKPTTESHQLRDGRVTLSTPAQRAGERARVETAARAELLGPQGSSLEVPPTDIATVDFSAPAPSPALTQRKEYSQILAEWSKEEITRAQHTRTRIVGGPDMISARNALLRYAENPARGNLSAEDMKAIRTKVEQRFKDQYIRGRINKEIARGREIDTPENRKLLRKKIIAKWGKYKGEFERGMLKNKAEFDKVVQEEALQAGRVSFRKQIQQHYRRIIPAGATLTVKPSIRHDRRSAQDLIAETMRTIDALLQPSQGIESRVPQTSTDVVSDYLERAIPLRRELDRITAEIEGINTKLKRDAGVVTTRERALGSLEKGSDAYVKLQEELKQQQAERTELEGLLENLETEQEKLIAERNKLDQLREKKYTVENLRALGLPLKTEIEELTSINVELASIDKDAAEVRAEISKISMHLDRPGAREAREAAQKELNELQSEKAEYQQLKRRLYARIEDKVKEAQRRGDLHPPKVSQLSKVEFSEQFLISQLQELRKQYENHPDRKIGPKMVQVLDDCLTMLEVAMRGSISRKAAQDYIDTKFPGFAAYKARIADEQRLREATAERTAATGVGAGAESAPAAPVKLRDLSLRTGVVSETAGKGARGPETLRPARLSPVPVLPGLGLSEEPLAAQPARQPIVKKKDPLVGIKEPDQPDHDRIRYLVGRGVDMVAHYNKLINDLPSVASCGEDFNKLYKLQLDYNKINEELRKDKLVLAIQLKEAGAGKVWPLDQDLTGVKTLIGDSLGDLFRENVHIPYEKGAVQQLPSAIHAYSTKGREVVDNNGGGSCLFESLVIARDSVDSDSDHTIQLNASGAASILRSEIAAEIVRNPEGRYKKVVAERIRDDGLKGNKYWKTARDEVGEQHAGESPEDYDFRCYCAWIQLPTTWGGQPEITAYSNMIEQPIICFTNVERFIGAPNIANPARFEADPDLITDHQRINPFVLINRGTHRGAGHFETALPSGVIVPQVKKNTVPPIDPHYFDDSRQPRPVGPLAVDLSGLEAEEKDAAAAQERELKEREHGGASAEDVAAG